jgi:hypothetical protein
MANRLHVESWHDTQPLDTGNTTPAPFQYAILSRRKKSDVEIIIHYLTPTFAKTRPTCRTEKKMNQVLLIYYPQIYLQTNKLTNLKKLVLYSSHPAGL